MIYLDNAATTPVLSDVRKAMEPYLTDGFGNPSSTHAMGQAAREAVEDARRRIAAALSCYPDEIIFTSGGTESDNLAILGAVAASQRRSIVTTGIEHPAVLNACAFLERMGYSVTYVGVDHRGILNMDELQTAVNDDTALVAVMAVNNEVGSIQPITEAATIAKAHGSLFFTDAVQAVGRIPLQFSSSPIDLLSLSGHKLGAPKGIAALLVRRGTPLSPLLHGGGQERGLRSGTENVPAIVGLAAAVEHAVKVIAAGQIAREQTTMIQALLDTAREIPFTHVYHTPHTTAPGILTLCFDYLNGADLVSLLSAKGICVSTSSACASGTGAPSHVLMAMGLSPDTARGALRISLGYHNTPDEIQTLCRILPQCVGMLRKQNPIYKKRKENQNHE